MKKLIFQKNALKELQYWKDNNNNIFRRIIELIDSALMSPFSGIGKPEPLKYDKHGYWARRINKEHRLVYKVSKDSIIIVSCRFHYEK